MSEIIERARELRKTIESLAVEHLDDEHAAAAAELFPAWDGNGRDYKAGERVRRDGILYKVLQDHTSQPGWDPENASSLFAEVLTSESGEPLEWKQPDSTNPYMTGDKVLFEGKVYESIIDNNVWSPSAYPQGWKEVA